MVINKPQSMPATAPARVVPRQKMPSTMAGTKADAAMENEAETIGRISEGLSAATNAADSATESSANLVIITRCSGDARRRVSGPGRERDAFDDNGTESVQIDQGGEFGPVAKGS